jgi:DNA topoisomerase-3
MISREANRRYGYTAERTLGALQGLYENHKLISYPRTDSRYLTNDIFNDVNAILEYVHAHAHYPSLSLQPGS